MSNVRRISIDVNQNAETKYTNQLFRKVTLRSFEVNFTEIPTEITPANHINADILGRAEAIAI